MMHGPAVVASRVAANARGPKKDTQHLSCRTSFAQVISEMEQVRAFRKGFIRPSLYTAIVRKASSRCSPESIVNVPR